MKIKECVYSTLKFSNLLALAAEKAIFPSGPRPLLVLRKNPFSSKWNENILLQFQTQKTRWGKWRWAHDLRVSSINFFETNFERLAFNVDQGQWVPWGVAKFGEKFLFYYYNSYRGFSFPNDTVDDFLSTKWQRPNGQTFYLSTFKEDV